VVLCWVLALAPAGLAAAPPAARGPDVEAREAPLYETGLTELDHLQALFAPALAANLKRFAGRERQVTGFGAGSQYPQIWLRDSATLLPLARWLYDREALTSWLEEHLAAQAENGALRDWIAAGPPAAFREWAPRVQALGPTGASMLSVDTNTTEADQEASAVRAAALAFEATGDVAWLLKPIAGQPLLRRLERALAYRLEGRSIRDGLIESALTADWGDVSPSYPDQRAIYLDERTPRVVGLYANALAVQAARDLAGLCAHVGDGACAAHWQARATALAATSARTFWQPRLGFFRMHVLTTPELARGFPDSHASFALGGNTQALLAGLATPAQAARVVANAEARRRRYGLDSIAGVVLPPWPAGTFAHPALARAWHYQNGGQWDWWSGRFLFAAFRAGQSELALAQLRVVARRVVRSGGLYEWYDRAGSGQGSATYAGAAGALAQALYEGLFGVELRLGRLDLRVRLGAQPGMLRLFQPASGTRVSYRHVPELARRRLRFEVTSNAPTAGTLALRLPAGWSARAVQRDGQALAFERESVGADRYVVMATAWERTHAFVVTLEPDGQRTLGR
jgi:hypothetical protein